MNYLYFIENYFYFTINTCSLMWNYFYLIRKSFYLTLNYSSLSMSCSWYVWSFYFNKWIYFSYDSSVLTLLKLPPLTSVTLLAPFNLIYTPPPSIFTSLISSPNLSITLFNFSFSSISYLISSFNIFSISFLNCNYFSNYFIFLLS